MDIRNILTVIFLLLGFICFVITAVGVFRLKDFYSRLHAAGVCESAGLVLCSIGFLIYGALVVSGIYTPISSKILVEDEERAKWCHTEGVTKMLWGLDLAFFVMYRCSVFPAVLWLAAFLVLTVVIIIMAYKNNGKYLK